MDSQPILTSAESPDAADQTIMPAARALFDQRQRRVHARTDRLFARLMAGQWLAAIGIALWLSPHTWSGTAGQIHPHVWAALLLGGLITSLPVFLARTRPGETLTRHCIAVGQLLMSALLIHLTDGRIETHFHVFGSLAFLACYRDWRVLLTGTLVTTADHFLRGVFWPQSIYGVPALVGPRWLEHAGWVIFEDVFLLISCQAILRDSLEICRRDARLQQNNSELEQQIEARSASLRATYVALEHAVEGVSELDVDGHYRVVNAAYAAMVGYTPEEMHAMSWQQIVVPGDLPHVEAALQAACGASNADEIGSSHRQPAGDPGKDGRGDHTGSGHTDSRKDAENSQRTGNDKIELETQGRRKDGSLFYNEIVLIPMRDRAGTVTGYYCFMKDISERKRLEDTILHQAYHDTLSGLPNRILFNDRVEQAMVRSQSRPAAVAVLFIDLDNFKFINDSLGHEQGDRLLIEVARRLQACARSEDTVARMGGDEFALLLAEAQGGEAAIQVAECVMDRLKEAVRLDSRDVFINCSIGIAFNSDTCRSAETMLRDADTAMYQAKLHGKSSYVVFDRSMNDRLVERMEIEIGLRRALDENEFRVYYQPIMNLETGKIAGAEALLRWEHPHLGLISPAKFIPIAEETGLVVPIGTWVLHEACRQARQWEDQFAAEAPFIISVNLSGRQLQEPDLCGTVAAILQNTGLLPGHLKLEITESAMVENVDEAIVKLNQLKALGVLLAVDDFGTGYSSLSYLQRFPVDTVKIDRSFVKVMGHEAQPAALVHAIIMLCRVMDLDVTGEGIENTDQLAQLQSLGCDLGQGYLFARPLTSSAFTDLLRRKYTIPLAPVHDPVLSLLDDIPSAA